MNQPSRRLAPVLALIGFVALVGGCNHGGPGPHTTAAPGATSAPPETPAPAPTAAPPTVPTTAPVALPPAVHWQRSSAEYRAVHLQIYRQAREALPRLAAGHARGTWAVSMDVDDTLIDNSLYAVERSRAGQRYSLESWADWVRRRAAPSMPGAISFLRAVQELGGVVAVITNRGESQCEDTRENLRLQSIPFDALLCRPEQAPGEKEGRWRALQEGKAAPGLGPVDIVMWVGDNIGDFPHLDQSLRDADDAAFGDFGDRFFVLPNPVYGSWERNPER